MTTTSVPRPASQQPLLLPAHLGPLAQLRTGRLARRLPQLLVGLWLYGASLALMVASGLGVPPWGVLDVAVSAYLPLTLGETIVLTSFVVLLLWLPLREVPGIGTLANAVLVGLSTDATLAVLPGSLGPDAALGVRVALVAAGVLLNGVATALYIGAQLGRGPRDGLMTGLARVSGRSLRLVRTCLEVVVVLVGLALGGPLGAGTVLYALAIGPLAQRLLPLVAVRLDVPAPSRQ
ncbi:membrane protein YczE [Nocardioides bruguierae]|uniref:membrane protein YczE n=1 Tax=Nocardioides bruguierae TaxID=2945102 RepID=UPI00201FD006|nr:hypothetical protein [Nocardioides bruguierae]MCL8026545.1 hypothetical protein [Nocardioides bruguierae]